MTIEREPNTNIGKVDGPKWKLTLRTEPCLFNSGMKRLLNGWGIIPSGLQLTTL